MRSTSADMTPTDPQTAVLASYEAQREAMMAGDAAALGDELARDFSLTHMTGYVQTRDEWLQQVADGEMTYHSIQDVDARVVDAKADPGAPVVVARTRTDATIWGGRGLWRLQLEIHFTQHDGLWLAERTVASTW
jgi:Domain of unknown function (DUF4440)